ncbi:hypothetical protein PVNG_04474 [Plasmodium vivax North Korean]|uniref:PIR Superfamily Protein n=1 Tax=Plasmodium vivax North Korean TaxID=1035514 RepID=A0A0J9U509_PLAVI|nr:hypothetical protein PVNG_04474 [Plasmodium vivax North Korean]
MEYSNEDYNTFKQYSYNHDVYLNCRGDIGDLYDSFPNEILEGQTENKNLIITDCLRLKKFLMKFNSKDDCKNKNCCQYINYFLNQRIQKDYNSNQSIFEIYKTYMNLENNSIIKNLCLTEINYMDLDKYNKIDKLYEAYYNCNFYISKKPKLSCNRAKSCLRAYNDIMTVYTKRNDAKFCKTLKDFKDFLEANEPTSTDECDSIFSASLLYPRECNQLLDEAKKLDSFMDQEHEKLEIKVELHRMVTGEASEEQTQGRSGVEAPGVGVPGYRTGMEASATLNHAQLVVGDKNEDPPNDNTHIPAKTIIYTSLGSVLPLATLYRVKTNYLKNLIIL